MRKINTAKPGMMWLLLSVLLAIAMVFSQTLLWAADADNDGFTDAEETGGTILGLTLNPNKKDLFVIWVPANPSYLPDGQDPLEYVKTLPIDVHQITADQVNADRSLPGSSLSQKAVRVSESLDPTITNPLVLGFSYEGTPIGRDEATVYTERIKIHIETTCGCPSDIQNPNWCNSCCDNTGVCGKAFFYKYIKHTIAHEIGHMIRPLAPVSARDRENFGGYHYKSGTNVILDQSVKFSQGKFSLGTTYTQQDKDNVTLK